MSAPVLQPTAVGYNVGFLSAEAITSLTRQTQEDTSTADIESIRDENNAEVAILTSNPAVEKRFEAIMLSAYTAPAKGDIVTVNSIKYQVMDVAVRKSLTWTRVSLHIRKPGSITFS